MRIHAFYKDQIECPKCGSEDCVEILYPTHRVEECPDCDHILYEDLADQKGDQD